MGLSWETVTLKLSPSSFSDSSFPLERLARVKSDVWFSFFTSLTGTQKLGRHVCQTHNSALKYDSLVETSLLTPR